MTKRHLLLLLVVLVSLVPTGVFPQPSKKLPIVHIGFAMDGPWERNKALQVLFEKEIKDLLRGEFDVRFPESKRIMADWTSEGVNEVNTRLLKDPQRAIIESAQRRLRPILLTTVTTVGGLLPLWFGGGPMYEPMAIAIIFGLVFATLLTLGVVPVLYSLFFGVSFKDFCYEEAP